MAITANKKHPSTDIKEGELIFLAQDSSDSSIGYQVAALKVPGIEDPVAIHFDPRPQFNPSRRWFYKGNNFLKALDPITFTEEIASHFASLEEVGALDNTVVANVVGTGQVLFSGSKATSLGSTSVSTITKISDNTAVASDNTPQNPSSNIVGTANATTAAEVTKGFFASIPTWAYFLIIPVLLFALVFLAKKLFGGKKRKNPDR